MNPVPTKTFVLDIGRKCSINCLFCYYKHLGDLRRQGWISKKEIFKEINNGIKRGNNRTELTGGEPTLHPDIEEIISYLKEKNILSCIISNALISSDKLSSLINCGVDEFLFSVHGLETTHDFLTQCSGARKQQGKTFCFLKEINLKNGFRFNFVINKYNQEEIYATSVYMSQFNPTMVNFINMNPHHGWERDKETKNIIADLRVVEKQLNLAIEYLENLNIGVNVRYYPMCRIDEKYRRCICNDLHVLFDDKEWDYCIESKTFLNYKKHAINMSDNIEEKGEPCCLCDLQNICGGANKHFHKASNEVYEEVLIPHIIFNKDFDKSDFYFYRKNNVLTLSE